MNFDEDFAHLDSLGLGGVRLCYTTLEIGGLDFHLRVLRDNQQCPDSIDDVEHLGISSATWPLFGVLWQSEELLSHLMSNEEVGSKKVLEIGCGIALASLVLKRRGIDITATDLNPHAGTFLDFNTQINRMDEVAFGQAGWQGGESSLGQFDLLVGSDLLYDHHNLAPLVDYIDHHVRPDGEVILVDPGRGLTSKFTRLLSALNFSATVLQEMFTARDGSAESYWIMRFKRYAENQVPVK